MTRQIIACGDSLDLLKQLPDGSVSAMVTDPPYGLTTTPPDMARVLGAWLEGKPAEAKGGGFMGRSWDALVPGPEMWRETVRVMRPGAHGLVFAGPRAADLMGLALRLGGFEIRDCLAWIQGQGMPKSMDLGNGHGTGLKPGYEPILLVRKPLDGTTRGNYAAHGTGGIGIDACRTPYGSQEDRERMSASVEATRARGGLGSGWKNKSNLTNANPAHPLGRHPPNVIVDESAAEDLGEFSRYFYCPKASVGEKERGLGAFPLVNITGRAEGSPGRLNPRAGAGAGSDRRNPHPTIKPIALMRWLIRLVSIAPDGIVIDPFAGSGSTLLAARIEKINALGFEIDPSYVDVARARLEACG